MPEAVIHPMPQELTAFGLGKLSERAAAVVAAHLETCPACRQAVAGIAADSFLNKVRAAAPGASLFPSRSARPGNAPSSAGQPAVPTTPYLDVPPELAQHPRYRILRELGRGGMGVVYQARHKEMDRQVVIKVINRALLDRPDALERFRREIRAAAQLSHPNIVAAYDAEQAGESHILVMEFVPGQNLAEVLHKKGPLPVAKACHYVRQAAVGLHHAHRRGMVHRDIKPQNLMLTPKDQIKILDFGLAKVVSESGTCTGLTLSNSCMGTPEYCAPEQAKDARTADIRADLYSLGCTLYCLLAGRPPFREDTPLNTFLAHVQKEPPPLPQLRPDVPERLWRVVARLLAKEPAQRYQKPIEVVQALAPFVKPGTKPEAKGVSAPAAGVASPGKATVIETDTSQMHKILRDMPGKKVAKEVTTKDEAASAIAIPTDAVAAPKEVGRAHKGTKQSLRVWGKRPGVLAAAVGISLVLVLMAAIIWGKGHMPNGDTDEVVSSKSGKEVPKLPPTSAVVVPPHLNKPGTKSASQSRADLPVDASIDALRQALKHEDPAMRELAAARLAERGPEAEMALNDLEEMLTDAKNPTKVRATAVFAIGKIGPKAKPVVHVLAKSLQRSQPLEIRQNAAMALVQISYPANKEAIPDILDAIENDKDNDVRHKCVWALFGMDKEKFKDSGADKLLTKMLSERGEDMVLARYDAARKLAQVLRDEAPDKTADVLLEMLTNTTIKVYAGTEVKAEKGRTEIHANLGGDACFLAAQALVWLGKKASGRQDVIDALKAATKDADPKLRETATTALKDLGVP